MYRRYGYAEYGLCGTDGAHSELFDLAVKLLDFSAPAAHLLYSLRGSCTVCVVKGAVLFITI